MTWHVNYRRYNEKTIALEGVISPESMHLYTFSAAISTQKQEELLAYIRDNKVVYVSHGHIVMDLIKNCGFADVKVADWYRVNYELFYAGIKELKKWASVIRVQRFWRWCSWKKHKPSLENIKAFQNTSLPREIFHMIVEIYFNPRQGTGSATQSRAQRRA